MRWLRLLLICFAFRSMACALDREAFTFTKYSLQVTLDSSQQRLGVRGKITLRNDSPSPQKYLCLQISSSLGWRSIQIEGRPVEFVSQVYTSDIDHTGKLSEAIVTLPREIITRGTVDLDIGYEGTIALDTTRLERIGVPKEVARRSDWDEIRSSFTAVRGVGFVTWYPVATEAASLSDGNSVADTVVRWKQRERSADMRFAFAGEGQGYGSVFCSGESAKEPQKTATDCSILPLNLSIPTFAAANYTVLDRPSITIHYLPEHKNAAEKFALSAESKLAWVTDWFGSPKEKIQVVELLNPQSSPFENGTTLMTPLVQSASAKYDLAAVHQLTHAALSSSRLWIYEGLAHFAQAMEIERTSGRQAALDFVNSHLEAVLSAEKLNASKKEAASESLINTSVEEFYRSKAMCVWWMLRDMVGETAFKRALASYKSQADTEPSYMQHLLEAQSHRDLEWFFDDWIYRDRGLPDFKVVSAYPRKLVGGGYMVTVTVSNMGGAGAEVPIILRMQSGEISAARLEVRAKATASIRIEAASTPQEVVVNDGSVPESDLTNNSYKIVLPAN